RPLGRLPALDGVRGVALLLVVVLHTPAAVASYFDYVPRGAFLGVDVFFVLSGFLITSILLAEDALGRIRFLAFYRRRAMRVLPALFALVLVLYVYATVTDLPGDTVPSLVSVVFYY